MGELQDRIQKLRKLLTKNPMPLLDALVYSIEEIVADIPSYESFVSASQIVQDSNYNYALRAWAKKWAK